MRRNRSKGAVLALVCLFAPAVAAAAPVALNIRVIHAHNKSKEIDPQLKDLAKDLAKLAFTGYALKDQATFNLDTGAAARMQLPDGEWMAVRAQEITKDGGLRLELAVEKLKFKSTVTIAAGATLAVGGPPFDAGALILAITRPGSTATTAGP